jgi:hypothetical protein
MENTPQGQPNPRSHNLYHPKNVNYEKIKQLITLLNWNNITLQRTGIEPSLVFVPSKAMTSSNRVWQRYTLPFTPQGIFPQLEKSPSPKPSSRGVPLVVGKSSLSLLLWHAMFPFFHSQGLIHCLRHIVHLEILHISENSRNFELGKIIKIF